MDHFQLQLYCFPFVQETSQIPIYYKAFARFLMYILCIYVLQATFVDHI